MGVINPLFGGEPVVKTSKKLYAREMAELTGDDIFKADATAD